MTKVAGSYMLSLIALLSNCVFTILAYLALHSVF
jgi:hypothetical protein